MRFPCLVFTASLALLTTTASAQYAGGGGNGFGRGGGGGLHGVTRRTYMGVPNTMAARYFQASGVPVVDPRTQNAALQAGNGSFLAQRPNSAPPPPSPRLSAPASLAGQNRVPPRPTVPPPAASRVQGIAQASR